MARNKLIYSYNLILIGTTPLNLCKKVALEKVAQSENLIKGTDQGKEKQKSLKIQKYRKLCQEKTEGLLDVIPTA